MPKALIPCMRGLPSSLDTEKFVPTELKKSTINCHQNQNSTVIEKLVKCHTNNIMPKPMVSRHWTLNNPWFTQLETMKERLKMEKWSKNRFMCTWFRSLYHWQECQMKIEPTIARWRKLRHGPSLSQSREQIKTSDLSLNSTKTPIMIS